jgi:hypothetical protein
MLSPALLRIGKLTCDAQLLQDVTLLWLLTVDKAGR